MIQTSRGTHLKSLIQMFRRLRSTYKFTFPWLISKKCLLVKHLRITRRFFKQAHTREYKVHNIHICVKVIQLHNSLYKVLYTLTIKVTYLFIIKELPKEFENMLCWMNFIYLTILSLIHSIVFNSELPPLSPHPEAI